MAKETKTVLEREYNIPLRRKFVNIPKYQRTKKAIKTVREFLVRHMKSENVKLGRYLNLHIWRHGNKNPPHHVSVLAKKDSEGNVTAEIKGAPEDKKIVKAPAKKTEQKSENSEGDKTKQQAEQKKPEVAQRAQSSDLKEEKKSPKKTETGKDAGELKSKAAPKVEKTSPSEQVPQKPKPKKTEKKADEVQ